jgi:hypothetical protein
MAATFPKDFLASGDAPAEGARVGITAVVYDVQRRWSGGLQIFELVISSPSMPFFARILMMVHTSCF